MSVQTFRAILTGLRPLSFKERLCPATDGGLGGELIDRLELIKLIIMHNMYLLIQLLESVEMTASFCPQIR
jgi:hypothetical protein